jgi:hypothetical protein
MEPRIGEPDRTGLVHVSRSGADNAASVPASAPDTVAAPQALFRPLFLRVRMRGSGVIVRQLAVVMRGCRVFLGMLVTAVLVLMGRFAMVMGCRLMVASGGVMMFGRRMGLCRSGHGASPYVGPLEWWPLG